MKVELYFTPEESASIFSQVGLVVEMREMEFYFQRHGSAEEKTILSVWIVENPHNGKPEKLSDMFRKYIQMKKKELFLSEDNKLKILNLFEK